MYLCGFQRVGDNWPSRWRVVSPANVPAAAGPETGSLPACPAETACSADEDYGQCGHILHAADAVHLYFQVCTHMKSKDIKTYRPFRIKFNDKYKYKLIDFVVLCSILGMHLFGCKFSIQTENGDTIPDRKNFDTLLWAIVTVFQVSFDFTSQ